VEEEVAAVEDDEVVIQVQKEKRLFVELQAQKS
jgi:hypothetical protein